MVIYRGNRMRELFSDDQARMKHILENQVFGIASIEIIYQTTTRYILGYDNEIGDGLDINFVCADSAEIAKEGILSDFIERTSEAKFEIQEGELINNDYRPTLSY